VGHGVVSSILGTSESLVGLAHQTLTCGKRFRSTEEVSNEVTGVIRHINNEGVQTGIQDFPKRWTAVIKHNGDFIEGL
jgi:hypothetical protein